MLTEFLNFAQKLLQNVDIEEQIQQIFQRKNLQILAEYN